MRAHGEGAHWNLLESRNPESQKGVAKFEFVWLISISDENEMMFVGSRSRSPDRLA